MPHVRKADILAVVRELWGSTGVLEDEAKCILAEKLIADLWDGKKSGIPMNLTGQPLKQALGDRWLGNKERTAAKMPIFSNVLAQDPYFSLKEVEGNQHPFVKLRISRLSQLITNPDLIKEYRNPGRAPAATAGTAQNPQAAAFKLSEEGLPIRPGQPVCQHYLKHGWCLFKQDCWYSHPPDKAAKKKPPNIVTSDDLVESHLESGVMLRGGVYPVRLGRPTCSFYIKNGWCLYKAKCRNNHPVLQTQESTAAAGRASVTSPIQDMPDKPLVRQPPTQMLLNVIIDSVYPPRSGKENFIKGQLAKRILELQLQPKDVADTDKAYDMAMAAAGIYLGQWWPTQNLYDPMTKPYKSLADVMGGDRFYRLSRNNQMLTLLLGELIAAGGNVAAERLSHMADQVWPPTAGREAWLRGKLAKWLMTAGFSGEKGQVLRQVLAVGPDAPTVFRIDMAQAGEYLRRCWEMQQHPHDSSTPPWTQFKPLIAGDRFLYIEPAPGRPNSQHISIDLADMLENYQALLRAAQSNKGGQAPQANAVGGGSIRPVNAGAGSSAAAAAAANDDGMDLDDDDDVADGVVTAVHIRPAREEPWDNCSSTPTAAAAAGPSSSRAAQQQQQQQLIRPGAVISSRPSSAHASSQGDPVAEAEADLAALQNLVYEPPVDMQWWWPSSRPEHPGWAWTEIAIKLVDSAGEEAVLQLAEMTQHLELCPILAMACATYKSQPHLLQFFAPHVAVGGLEMPSTVYLIDIMKSGPGVKQVLDLIRPILSSPQNTKVCHASKLWSGQLAQFFNINLNNYYDTQQANFIWNCLRHEAGRAHHLTGAALKSTETVSLSALLRTFDFYHPIRHAATGQDQKRVWQERPLSEELITCAAADVAYLLPLMEVQVRAIRTIAAEVQQKQQQQRATMSSRAAALFLNTNLPPALSAPNVMECLAAGAETGAGSVSMQKIAEWGELDAFHQMPLH